MYSSFPIPILVPRTSTLRVRMSLFVLPVSLSECGSIPGFRPRAPRRISKTDMKVNGPVAAMLHTMAQEQIDLKATI